MAAGSKGVIPQPAAVDANLRWQSGTLFVQDINVVRLAFAKIGLYDRDLCQPDQQEEGYMQFENQHRYPDHNS